MAPSSARKAATPPPQVICSDTWLSPMASASTPLEFSAAGGCKAASPEREADRFQFRRRQNLFQRREVGVGNARQGHVLFAGGQRTARIRQPQRCHVAGETALRFQLQQARGVRLRQRRQFRVRRQHPLQRHADDAVAFAHAGGVEVIANLAADEFRRRRQRIERERRPKKSGGAAASRWCGAAPRPPAGCRPGPARARSSAVCVSEN